MNISINLSIYQIISIIVSLIQIIIYVIIFFKLHRLKSSSNNQSITPLNITTLLNKGKELFKKIIGTPNPDTFTLNNVLNFLKSSEPKQNDDEDNKSNG